MIKAQTEYYCQKENSDCDSVNFIVNNEVKGNDYIQVRPGLWDRWRSTVDAIAYYEWVVSEIKNLQRELQIEVTP